MWAPGREAKNKFVELEIDKNALGASLSFVSNIFEVSEYQYIRGGCLTDQLGVIIVEFSSDKTNWIGDDSDTIAANDPKSYKVPITNIYCRVRVVNGPAPQTSFHIEIYATH